MDAPLRVLDRCRVRWAVVDSVHGDSAVVIGPTLAWAAGRLELGLVAPRPTGPVASHPRSLAGHETGYPVELRVF